MKLNHLHPFLKAGEGPAGGVGVPAVGGPDSVPVAQHGQSSDAAHPMDSRPASVLNEESDDLGASFMDQDSSSQTPRGNEAASEQQPSSFFDEGFDVNTLEEPLQGKYKEMESAYSDRMAQLPDSEVLGLIGTKSDAFDRLVAMPEFQEWAESQTGSEAEATPGSQAAADSANLLEGLDEDMQQALTTLVQQRVDAAVAERVTPVADAFYAKEAESTLSGLREQHGAETFDRLAPQMQALMESVDGLDVNQAFMLARFPEMQAAAARQVRQTTEQKFHANMEGDGSIGTEPEMSRSVKSPADAVNLALKMVRSGHPDAFDPTRLPPGYRGE